MSTRRLRRFALALATVGWFAFALFGATNAGAAGPEHISRFTVHLGVRADGSMRVVETIEYDFGANSSHGIDRFLDTRQRYDDDYDREYPLSDLAVESTGAPDQFRVDSQSGGRTRIRIGDPDRTVTGRFAYTIEYDLDGVVNAQPGDDELYWNVTGHGWDVAIDAVSVTVAVPGGPSRVACFAGAKGTDRACALSYIGTRPVDGAGGEDRGGDDGEPVAVFGDVGLTAHEGITVVVAIPDVDGDVAEPTPILDDRSLADPRNFADMFAFTPAIGAGVAVLGLLLGAGVARVQWLVGRDRRAVGSATDVAFADQLESGDRVPLRDRTPTPVEFVPPDGLRPAQIGVLADEVAHTRDVSATIVDLAVRGYLRIEEITKDGRQDKVEDYRLVELRSEQARGELLPYERYLMEELFETGPDVLLSTRKNKFASAMRRTKAMLYDDIVERGYYLGRPDHQRGKWALLGVVALGLGVLITFFLAATSRYGLLGVPVVVAALALLAGSWWMPRRTPKGTGAYRRLKGFEEFIENSEKHRAQFAERANLFTEYLPYAVAFGATRKWAEALSVLELEAPDPSRWFIGPGVFAYADIGTRLDRFSSSASATLTSTPGSSGSSGFGGGGFSGGGGGGGGGGSW